MQTGKNDLTTGNILKKLLRVALPIMGTQLMQMTYNLVDVFFLGRVGTDAVAASGTAGMFMWLVSGPMLIGRMGAEIGVSQSLGRGDPQEAHAYCQNSVQLGLWLGAALGLMMVFLGRPLVGFFGIQEQNVVEDTIVYLAIVGLAVPFTFVSAAIVGTFNGSGNSRTPFWINSAGLVFNMVLDPLLIFGLNMGVMGAAVATAASQIFVTVLLLLAVKKSTRRPFEETRLMARPSARHMSSICRWSVPVALESVLFTFLSMVTTRFMAAYGAGAIAMTKVGSQVESLSWLVGGGYGSAVTSFVGQNYGAGKRERIDRCVGMSMGVMTLWGLMVSAVLIFWGGPLCMLFLPDESLLPLATSYMFIMAVSQLPMCLEGVTAGALRGCGQTAPPAIASAISNTLRVAFAWLLMRTSLGIDGIFWGITLSTILRGVWICLWYYRLRRKALAAS